MDSSTTTNRRRKASSQNNEVIVLDNDESTTLKKVKKEANAPKRRKKNSIDATPHEEANRQPNMSTVKREEPEPSPSLPVRPSPSLSTAAAEILELRQHLLMARQESVNNQQQLINASHQLIGTEMEMARKDGIFQNALREAELRAERAEKLLGSKQGGRDELNDKESRKKVIELTMQLGKDMKWASKREAELTKQLETERDEGVRAKEKIVELTRRLAEYENLSMAQLATAAVAAVDTVATKPVISKIAHSFNILSLYISGTHWGMTIDDAQKKLRAALKKCCEAKMKQLRKKKTKFEWDVCGKQTKTRFDAINHFLTKEHAEKVRAHGAAVSKPAVTSWLKFLEQAAE